MSVVSKGQTTRQHILDHAWRLATVVGLDGLTIGRLAEELELSKSGLFAHFGSKEALQVAVIEEAGRQFVQDVVLPALREPRGEPRVRALFERWLVWGERPGGCFFVSATAELDDRPGPARDVLVKVQKGWLAALATAVRLGVEEGHFQADLDGKQLAYEIYSLMLGCHLFARFLRDRSAATRARKGFETLLAAARKS